VLSDSALCDAVPTQNHRVPMSSLPAAVAVAGLVTADVRVATDVRVSADLGTADVWAPAAPTAGTSVSQGFKRIPMTSRYGRPTSSPNRGPG
jgi:hypothetical protein